MLLVYFVMGLTLAQPLKVTAYPKVALPVTVTLD
jgi:hypothetical protein